MRDIARAMEMEAASLYNHIDSKQSILNDLLMDIANRFTVGMQQIQSSSLTALEQLEALIDQHVDMTVGYTDAISLVPSEWIHLEEPHLKEFVTLRKNYEDAFKAVILAAIEEGSIAEVDVDVALFSTLSTLRWLYSWYTKQGIKVELLKKELKRTLLQGLISSL